jgi:hypothetical protein
VRRLRRGHYQKAIEMEARYRLLGRGYVRFMNRVEGPAENSQAQLVYVSGITGRASQLLSGFGPACRPAAPLFPDRPPIKPRLARKALSINFFRFSRS